MKGKESIKKKIICPSNFFSGVRVDPNTSPVVVGLSLYSSSLPGSGNTSEWTSLRLLICHTCGSSYHHVVSYPKLQPAKTIITLGSNSRPQFSAPPIIKADADPQTGYNSLQATLAGIDIWPCIFT